MDIDVLSESIENNNLDKAMKIISEIGENKDKNALPILIKYLQSTNNNSLRNGIAIALADIGCPEAVEPIINMIKSPKTKRNKGTLLYALESFDCSQYVELFVDLLCDNNFEVSRQAFILLENILKENPDKIRKRINLQIRSKIKTLQDKIDFLEEVAEEL